MLMNYHELTMDEPRDAPARRKQFLVICTVMAICFFSTAISSGAFSSVVIKDMEFPGGEYIYKMTKRDYAASMGLTRNIGSHLGMRENDLDDIVYSAFLDDPNAMTGRHLRFASGLLVTATTDDDDDEKKKKRKKKEDYKNILLAKNPQDFKELTVDESEEMTATELWNRLLYQSQVLPKVKAAVLQFPFTNGFVSALINSHKVIPALRQYAQQHNGGEPVVVLSTCSVKQSMCTHYAPLESGSDFLLGEQETGEYMKTFDNKYFVDQKGLHRAAKKVIPFYKSWTKNNEEKKRDPVKVSDRKDEPSTSNAKKSDILVASEKKEEVTPIESKSDPETNNEEEVNDSDENSEQQVNSMEDEIDSDENSDQQVDNSEEEVLGSTSEANSDQTKDEL